MNPILSGVSLRCFDVLQRNLIHSLEERSLVRDISRGDKKKAEESLGQQNIDLMVVQLLQGTEVAADHSINYWSISLNARGVTRAIYRYTN